MSTATTTAQTVIARIADLRAASRRNDGALRLEQLAREDNARSWDEDDNEALATLRGTALSVANRAVGEAIAAQEAATKALWAALPTNDAELDEVIALVRAEGVDDPILEQALLARYL